jgi:F-type H+-transporting ATPase subunit delta
MQQNPSRRRVAKFVADQLASGESVADVAKVLAAYSVAGGQIRSTDLLLRDIETALLRDYGHLCADVVSARQLSSETRNELAKMLKHETNAKTTELIETIDENLIGGLVVRTPEAELDASLKTKLTRLRAI